MTQGFGKADDRFQWSVFLVLCNRLMTLSLAVGVLAVSSLTRDNRPCLVQTLSKCAKMIPVMIWGALIARKTYSIKHCCVAALVTVGCTCFLLSGSTTSKKANDSSPKGFVLMLTYLAFDGFTATFQDKLFKGHQMSMFNQMLYVNACSAVVSICGLVGGGQLWEALSFVSNHPDALLFILLLSLAATLGQFVIVHTIQCFGALVFATIMTTRQFTSVLMSCVIFGHPLSLGQWCGTAVVFGSLYFNTFSKASGKRQPFRDGQKAQ